MKKYLLRVENLLLVAPLFVFFLLWLKLANSSSDLGMPSGVLWYLIKSSSYDIIVWELIFLIPYVMHWALRQKGHKKRTIQNIHVFLSVFLFIFLFLIPDNATSVVPGWHTTIFSFSPFGGAFNNWFSISVVLLLLLQLLFVIYSVRVLLKKSSAR